MDTRRHEDGRKRGAEAPPKSEVEVEFEDGRHSRQRGAMRFKRSKKKKNSYIILYQTNNQVNGFSQD